MIFHACMTVGCSGLSKHFSVSLLGNFVSLINRS